MIFKGPKKRAPVAAVPIETVAEELAHVREDAVHDVREAAPVHLQKKF